MAIIRAWVCGAVTFEGCRSVITGNVAYRSNFDRPKTRSFVIWNQIFIANLTTHLWSYETSGFYEAMKLIFLLILDLMIHH